MAPTGLSAKPPRELVCSRHRSAGTDQIPFGTTEFADNPEPRCPCLLLLDVSGSMRGQPIDELNAGLGTFKDELAADALAMKRVEVGIITFRPGSDGAAVSVSFDLPRAVRGFGDVLTRAVVDWKKAQERRFVFNPRAAVSEADKNAVRAKITTRRKVLEAALSSGAAELNGYRHASASKATSLLPQLKEAAQKVAQAEADLSVM